MTKEADTKGEDGFDWAACLNKYITMVKEELGIYSGRVFYTGRKDGQLTRQVMGRNMLSEVPHMVAEFLGKENPQDYTFHSFRRSSATAAADQGATAQQMVDFFGWNSHGMTNEYISTSNHQVTSMARRLGSTDTSNKDCQQKKEERKEKGKKKRKREVLESDSESSESSDTSSNSREDRKKRKYHKKGKGGKKVVIINM